MSNACYGVSSLRASEISPFDTLIFSLSRGASDRESPRSSDGGACFPVIVL
ncbi:MAG: hypothetical protein KFH87_02790 [Bacteroidetes bacterium]|nr:hypothetical protein [Bacteroidota bacterium]